MGAGGFAPGTGSTAGLGSAAGTGDGEGAVDPFDFSMPDTGVPLAELAGLAPFADLTTGDIFGSNTFGVCTCDGEILPVLLSFFTRPPELPSLFTGAATSGVFGFGTPAVGAELDFSVLTSFSVFKSSFGSGFFS